LIVGECREVFFLGCALLQVWGITVGFLFFWVGTGLFFFLEVDFVGSGNGWRWYVFFFRGGEGFLLWGFLEVVCLAVFLCS